MAFELLGICTSYIVTLRVSAFSVIQSTYTFRRIVLYVRGTKELFNPDTRGTNRGKIGIQLSSLRLNLYIILRQINLQNS